MQARLKFYGALLLVNFVSLAVVVAFFTYDWYLNDYRTLGEAVDAIISANSRWVTWSACAGCAGLLIAFMLVVGVLLQNSDEMDAEGSKEFALGALIHVQCP